MPHHHPLRVSGLTAIDPVSTPAHVSPPASSSNGVPTFAEVYCRKRKLPAADFGSALLRDALPPVARRVRFLLALIPRYFEPDLIFLHHVGQLRRIEDLRYEEIDFRQDRSNRSFLRGKLRLRISTRRLRQIVERTLGDSPAELSPLLTSLVRSSHPGSDDSRPPRLA